MDRAARSMPRRSASSDRDPVHVAMRNETAAIAPQMRPNRATMRAVTVPTPITTCVSSVARVQADT